jgi:hypothetical protein
VGSSGRSSVISKTNLQNANKKKLNREDTKMQCAYFPTKNCPGLPSAGTVGAHARACQRFGTAWWSAAGCAREDDILGVGECRHADGSVQIAQAVETLVAMQIAQVIPRKSALVLVLLQLQQRCSRPFSKIPNAHLLISIYILQTQRNTPFYHTT